MRLGLLVCVVLGALSSSPAAAATRVFIARVTPAQDVPASMVTPLDDRILLAARKRTGFEVLGERDVQAVMDAEARRQAAGCDSDVDCAAELAGALDANQLVTGQLGRLGSTWVLSLTRVDRTTLVVLAQAVREATGDSPVALLGSIDGQVAEVLRSPDAPPTPLFLGGVAVGSVGVVGLAVGTVGAILSWTSFLAARGDLEGTNLTPDEKVTRRQKAIDDGNVTNGVALVGWVAGGVAVATGVGFMMIGSE
jgi:hypothetical protein